MYSLLSRAEHCAAELCSRYRTKVTTLSMGKSVRHRRFGTLHDVEHISGTCLTNYMEQGLLVKATVA